MAVATHRHHHGHSCGEIESYRWKTWWIEVQEKQEAEGISKEGRRVKVM